MSMTDREELTSVASKGSDFSYLTKDRVYPLEKVFEQYERDLSAVTEKTKNFLGVLLPFITVAYGSGALFLAKAGGLDFIVSGMLVMTLGTLTRSVYLAKNSYSTHTVDSIDNADELCKIILVPSNSDGEVLGRYANGLAMSASSMRVVAAERGKNINAAFNAFFIAFILFLLALAFGLSNIREQVVRENELQSSHYERPVMIRPAQNTTSGSGTTGSTAIDSRDTTSGATTTKGGTGGTTK